MESVLRGCEECVALLLKSGADVNSRNSQGETALVYAARTEFGPGQEDWGLPADANEGTFLSITQQLLKAGADVNVHGVGSLSALSWAVATRKPHVLDALLKAGAHPNDSDKNGTTPLILAAALGDSNVVRQLLDGGADVNGRDVRGLSALDEAEFMANARSAAVLLKAGAKVGAQCGNPASPADLEESARVYLCSDSAHVAYNGDLGQKGLEFAVAGVPGHCASIRNGDSDTQETGQLLERVVILRKTPTGWEREFSEDYFAKNRNALLSGLFTNAPKLDRLLPMASKDYREAVSFQYVESCVASGLPSRVRWNRASGRIQALDDNGSYESELAQAR